MWWESYKRKTKGELWKKIVGILFPLHSVIRNKINMFFIYFTFSNQ